MPQKSAKSVKNVHVKNNPHIKNNVQATDSTEADGHEVRSTKASGQSAAEKSSCCTPLITPANMRQTVILSEILDKPLALRRNRRI